MKKILALVSGCLLLAVTAQANTITLGNTQPDLYTGTGPFVWGFNVTYANSILANPGTQFTISNFGPIAGGTAAIVGLPPVWSAATVANDIVFTYAGLPQSIVSGTFTFGIPSAFGGSGMVSTYNSTDFSLSTFLEKGTLVQSGAFGSIVVPDRGVPDGGMTLALLGLGLTAVATLRQKLLK